MPFSSINFLLILPLMLLAYWNLPTKWKRVWILLCSVVVYLSAGWVDLSLLLAVTWVNWLSHRLAPGRVRVGTAMIFLDVGILAWFKYRFFLADIGGFSRQPGALIIPLGISFYVFQLISYHLEIRRGILKETPTFFPFLLYIFFFPHHQAGPIMRPHVFLEAFKKGRQWCSVRFRIGLFLILWGLVKKIWIADLLMSGRVRNLYLELEESGGHAGNVWLLGIMYGIQIYADFSGYSDIAVGLGGLFGFKLDRNFHQPYLASGPSEFWKRWHVTLSAWLRDNLYFPLGGSRRGNWRTMINLMVVMAVGGLWHGAAWTFILWGCLHGSYLVVERLWMDLWERAVWLKFIIFQLLVAVAWVPFRAGHLQTVLTLFQRPSAWGGQECLYAFVLLLGILAFSWVEEIQERRFPVTARWLCRLPNIYLAPAYSILVFLVISGVRFETTFIYQRF